MKSIVRFNEMDRPLSIMKELENWDPFFNSVINFPILGSRVAIDAYEDDKNVFIEATIPGMSKNNINVTYKDNVLTIEGSTQEEKEEKNKNYFKKEMYKGSFRRDIPIDAEIDENKINAKYKDGILKLTLPKINIEKPKESKIIQIEE